MGFWEDLTKNAGVGKPTNWSDPGSVASQFGGMTGLGRAAQNSWGIGQTAYGAATGPGGPFASTDYSGAAKQAADAYKTSWDQTTQANRPNQSTPFGSSSWTKDANGNWTQNTSLNPQLQSSLDALMKQWQTNSGQPLPTGDEARKAASDSIYSQETSRLDPRFAQQEEAMRTRLMNQGLDPNSEAFKTEMDNFGRTRNDAYQGAMNQSITGGGEEAQRQLQMAMALRNAPLMEMLGMGQFGQMPNFQGAGQQQTPDYLGAYGAQTRADADKWKGVWDLLGAGAKAVF